MRKANINKFKIIFLCLLIFSALEIPTGFIKAKILLVFAPDKSLTMHLRIFPRFESTICTDGVTPILFEVALIDSNQEPVPFSLINVSINNFTGKIQPKHPITGKDGRVTISIVPESLHVNNSSLDSDKPLDIDAFVKLESKKSKGIEWSGKLSLTPILLVHGFQDSSESMIPLKLYLEKRGLRVYAMDYSTDSNVESMAMDLGTSIENIKSDLLKANVYSDRVDIVAHSLGGLVARFYSTNKSFLEKQNLRKIIFINVPHNGTPWAEAGAALLSAPFLKQLYPTADLFTITFPTSINKGLNHKVQVANIALENDEIVPLASSMLDSWGIKTKIYRIGLEPLSFESVINSQASGSSFHRQILFFVPVFEEILKSLVNNQSYPRKRN